MPVTRDRQFVRVQLKFVVFAHVESTSFQKKVHIIVIYNEMGRYAKNEKQTRGDNNNMGGDRMVLVLRGMFS